MGTNGSEDDVGKYERRRSSVMIKIRDTIRGILNGSLSYVCREIKLRFRGRSGEGERRIKKYGRVLSRAPRRKTSMASFAEDTFGNVSRFIDAFY